MTLSRRTFLGSLAAPLVPGVAFGQGLSGQGTGFADLLQQIGGLPGIPPQLITAAAREFEMAYGPHAAPALVRNLGQGPLADGLERLETSQRDQVKFLARFLYTGEVTRNGQTQALYYPWSLSWHALSFATAPGLCGGPGFGHWAEAPDAGAAT